MKNVFKSKKIIVGIIAVLIVLLTGIFMFQKVDLFDSKYKAIGNNNMISIKVNETFSLNSDIRYKADSYKSEDTNIAIVLDDGTLSGINQGETRILRYQNDNLIGYIDIVVVNNDTSLKEITSNELTLTENLTKNKYEYNAVVDSNIDSVSLTAVSNDEKAYVNILGSSGGSNQAIGKSSFGGRVPGVFTIEVINGASKSTYKINVVKKIEDNNQNKDTSLQAIEKVGDMPGFTINFDPNITEYNPYTYTDGGTIKAIAKDQNAKVKICISNSYCNIGTGSAETGNAFNGKSVLPFIITVTNGNQTKQYKVNLTKKEVKLKNIDTHSKWYGFEIGFKDNIYTYNATTTKDSTAITATADDENSIVKICVDNNCKEAKSVLTYGLPFGDKKNISYKITVTNNGVSKQYTLNVKREAKLENISVNSTDCRIDFKENVTNYNISTASKNIIVSAKGKEKNNTIKICVDNNCKSAKNNVSLEQSFKNKSSLKFSIVVSEGNLSKNYVVNINKIGEATLSQLNINNSNIENFNKNKYEYTVDTDFQDGQEIKINAIPTENNSTTKYILNNQTNEVIFQNNLKVKFYNGMKINIKVINGNITKIYSVTLNKKKDKTAPIITNFTNSIGYEKWTNNKITLKWKIQEKDSGIKTVQYRLNNKGNWQDLKKEEWYGFTRNNNRKDKIAIRAIDNAGNISNTVITTLYIDKTAPSITAKIYKRNTKNKNSIGEFIYSTARDYEFSRWFNQDYSQGVEIKFEVSDSGSGLKDAIWNWNNSGLTSFKTTGMNKSGNKITDKINASSKNIYHSITAEGFRIVKYEVKDKVGNTKNITLKLKIDKTSPSTVKIVGKKSNKNGVKIDLTKNKWYNHNIYIEKISATDKNGIKYYQARDCSTKKITSTLSSWGEHTETEASPRCRQFRAVDKAGNAGNWSKNQYFQVLIYQWPVNGFKYLSTKFNQNGHKGIDIIQSQNQKNVNGANVTAIHNGEVVAAYNGCSDDYSKGYNASICGVKAAPYITQTGYGNYIVIKHKNKKETIYSVYGHLKPGIKVAKGSKVVKGQLIGYVGSTGNSTGPHLHFEIQNSKNKVVDPLLYVKK